MNPTFLRRFAGMISAVALAAAMADARVLAQSADATITATGCVNRAVNNGSLAGGPGVPPTTPNRAAVLANSNEPTDVILLNGATSAQPRAEGTSGGGAKTTTPKTYVLDGSLRDLEAHLGHQVEVTGTVRTLNEGAANTKTMIQHIRVASIRTVATECPKPAQK